MAQSVKRVVGLKNLGNTCYLNSVLQSLASSSSLRSFLENSKTSHGKRPLTEALHETLEELNKDYAQSHTITIEPPTRLMRVPPMAAMLNTKEQQDAHELMQLIMNILDDEHAPHVSSGLKNLSVKRQPTKPPVLPFLRPQPIHKKDSLPTFVNRTKGDVELVKLNGHQDNPFYGLMATTKKCTSCGRESPPHYQKFFGLSLSIPESPANAEECTLYKCLEQFSTQVVEDVEWEHQQTKSSPPKHIPHPSLVAGDAACEPVILSTSPSPYPFDKQDSISFSTSPPKSLPITFRTQPSHRFPISSSPPRHSSPPKPYFSSSPLSASPTTTSFPSSSPPQFNIPKPINSTSKTPRTLSPTRNLKPPMSAPLPIPSADRVSQTLSTSPPVSLRPCASGRCTATLNSTIARPPLSLCLHLRRLVFVAKTPVKLDTHVQFPILLDLASYCGLGIDISHGLSPKAPVPTNKLEYKLVAVIVHSGGACGGHFTVFRRLTPGSEKESSIWANISDDNLAFADEQQVMNSEAYMLYYERYVEGEEQKEPLDNATLLANLNVQIKSGLCFALQQTIGHTATLE